MKVEDFLAKAERFLTALKETLEKMEADDKKAEQAKNKKQLTDEEPNK